MGFGNKGAWGCFLRYACVRNPHLREQTAVSRTSQALKTPPKKEQNGLHYVNRRPTTDVRQTDPSVALRQLP